MKKYSKEQLNKLSREELIELVVRTQNENVLMAERMAVMNQHRFGQKSEKLEYIDGQIKFNEFEESYSPAEEEPVPVTSAAEPSKKKKGKREFDLSELDRVIVNHELTDEQLNEKFGENGWKKLPDRVYSKVAMHPAKYEVIEHHIAVYAAKNEDRIEKAPHPAELLNNSIASASLVAGIMNGKYTNALPLYRIEQEFKRNGIEISRQTMSNWVIRCTERYLSLIYDELHRCLLSNPVIQADETTCTVLNDGRESVQTSYMWLYRTGKFQKKKPVVLYDYQTARAAEHTIAFLNGFRGYLECDGYSAYHKIDNDIPGITVANCWAHARRHFANAMKIAKTADKSESFAAIALKKISTIYAEEDKISDVPSGKRIKVRRQRITRLVDDYFNWIKDNQSKVLPKSEVGKGIQYSLNQEKYMRVFLESGDVPIDNSASEAAIRPFTVGRKNWVMINTINGAKASAVVYSIVETAKANKLNPYEYLNHLLTVIPQHMEDTNTAFVKDLLPWSIALPSACHNRI